MSLEEIENRSYLENKLIQYEKIPCVYIKIKKYVCTKHPHLKPMNRGAMRQHIERKHGLNFYTGESLTKDKNQQIKVGEIAKEWSSYQSPKQAQEIDPFFIGADKLKIIFENKNPIVARILAEFFLPEGKLKNIVRFFLIISYVCKDDPDKIQYYLNLYFHP